MNNDLELLQLIFHEEYCRIEIQNNMVEITNLNSDLKGYVRFWIQDQDEDENENRLCCGIEFITNKMGISGSEILRRIERFCKERSQGVNFLSLQDGSQIQQYGYDFSLFVINILKKGISYYNERGYLQKSFVEDVSYWNSIKNENFINTVKQVNDKKMSEYNDYLIFREFKDLNVSEMLNFVVSFDTFENDTFLDVGIYIYDNVRFEKEITDHELKLLIYLYNLCCIFIHYGDDDEGMLYKTLD